jgi:ubiquitin-conjugating enzyme E2 J1
VQISEAGPNPDFDAAPLEDNLFEWHFTIRGPPGTAFEGGRYHGRITLPPEYPFKPPSIALLNASGRFTVGKKICLSVSAHHPEHWQPAWGIRTIITALIAFFPSKAEGALAGLDYSDSERRKLATASRCWRCPTCELAMSEALPVADAAENGDADAAESTLPPPPAELAFAHEAPPGESSAAPSSTKPSTSASSTAAPTASASTLGESAPAGQTSSVADTSSAPPPPPVAPLAESAPGATAAESRLSSAPAPTLAGDDVAAGEGPSATEHEEAQAPTGASPSAASHAPPPMRDPRVGGARQSAAQQGGMDTLGIVAAVLVGLIALLITRKLTGDEEL